MKRKFVLVFIIIFIVELLGVQDKIYAASSKIIKVEAGYDHNMALKEDGTVWTWGNNGYGELGDGTQNTIPKNPVQVKGLSDIITIDAGDNFSFAVKKDGTVWAWGRNDYSQLGDGDSSNKNTPEQIEGLSGIVDIACGSSFAIALKNDGTVWIWGLNFGNLGLGSSSPTVSHPVEVNISNVISIKTGSHHTLALKSNGELWAWGLNGFGECGDDTTTKIRTPVHIMNGVTSISTGRNNSYAIKDDGTVWGWGMNTDGQLGIGTHQKVVSLPVQMTGVSNVKYITGGTYHTMLLKNDGTVWVCGNDMWGELGDNITYNGTDNIKTEFIQLNGISGATYVSGGNYYTVVSLQDGSVWGCGINSCGQLGEPF